VSTANWVRVGVAVLVLVIGLLALPGPLIDAWYLGQVTGQVWLATTFIVVVLCLYACGVGYVLHESFELAREIEEDQK